MFNRQKVLVLFYRYRWVIGVAFLLLGGVKFYHYNYIQPKEHARNLKLPGLRDFVCRGTPFKREASACGERSIYSEADWGVTSYITIYGVKTQEEAEEISHFLIATRKQGLQEHIPINLRVYSSPRGEGREPQKYKILDRDI